MSFRSNYRPRLKQPVSNVTKYPPTPLSTIYSLSLFFSTTTCLFALHQVIFSAVTRQFLPLQGLSTCMICYPSLGAEHNYPTIIIYFHNYCFLSLVREQDRYHSNVVALQVPCHSSLFIFG